MQSKVKLFIPILCILAGLGLLFYPWISERLFENRTDSIVSAYQVQAKDMAGDEKNEQLELAEAYNAQLSQATVELTDPFSQMETDDSQNLAYDSVLSFGNMGMMGTIEIPKISVFLPIYHGTSNEVLESGIGHLEGSSLPIGGETCHAVLSGHTGLNSAKLFTDLTELEEGDLFFIHILDDTLAYRVCGISVVEPEDISELLIQSGRDIVTLVTCTPYGVNTHRLLVTGERTEYTEDIHEEAVVESDATAQSSLWMRSYRNAVLLGLAIAAAFFFLGVLFRRRRKRKERI